MQAVAIPFFVVPSQKEEIVNHPSIAASSDSCSEDEWYSTAGSDVPSLVDSPDLKTKRARVQFNETVVVCKTYSSENYGTQI